MILMYSQGICEICRFVSLYMFIMILRTEAFSDFWIPLPTAALLALVMRLQLECDGEDRNTWDMAAWFSKNLTDVHCLWAETMRESAGFLTY